MVKVLTGDLLQSEAQTLVNTVNCVGIMGKGIALEFKKAYPQMFKDYVVRCNAKQVRLGVPYLFRSLTGKWIINFPTKDHWRSLAKLSDIVEGLAYLEKHYQAWGITSLAVPPLGCGNGQLEWRVVGPTLFRSLQRLAIPVELYAPAGTPLEELQSSFLDAKQPIESVSLDSSKVRPAWVALAEIVRRIGERPYHWPIGRTSFQKLTYVATELGLPTGLEFTKGSYGPYSSGLKQVESKLMLNGLLTESRLGSMQRVTEGETLQDARFAFQGNINEWGGIIDRTVDLFLRVRSTNDAELLATSMYSARRLLESGTPPTEREVVSDVLHWKAKRKPAIYENDVREAIQLLVGKQLIKLRQESSPPNTTEQLVLI